MAGVLSAALLACAGALHAQGGADGESLGALRHGPLVVWFLAASTKPPQSNLDAVAALHNATPLNYSEHTASNFGQNASTYGQSASTFGVDADSPTIGTPSIPADQDATSAKPNGIGYQQRQASNFGQNAGSYGTASSNIGQEASTAGQDCQQLWTECGELRNGGEQCGAERFGLWGREQQQNERRSGAGGERGGGGTTAVEQSGGRAVEGDAATGVSRSADAIHRGGSGPVEGAADGGARDGGFSGCAAGNAAGVVVGRDGHGVWAGDAAAGGVLSEWGDGQLGGRAGGGDSCAGAAYAGGARVCVVAERTDVGLPGVCAVGD